MIDSYIKFVFRFRWLVMTLAIVVCAMLGLGAEKLRFSSDYRDFFKPDNPKLLAFEALQQKYSKHNNAFIAIAPEDKDVFTAETLKALHEFTQLAWKLPHVSRVDSLTNFQHVKGVDDELIVRDLVPDPNQLDSAAIEVIKSTAAREKELVGVLLSPDFTVAGINLSLTETATTDTGKPELDKALKELINAIKKDHHGLNVYVSGSVMIDRAFDTEAESDVNTLYPIMMLVLVALTWFFMRSIAATIGTIVCIVLAAIASLGAAGWMGIKITAISVTAPTIIMTLSLAHCMHVVASARESLRETGDTREALRLSLRQNFLPIFLTTLNTVIGFLAINFGEVPPLIDLGTIVSVGITTVYVLSLTFLPAFISVFGLRKAASAYPGQMYARIALWVAKRHKPVLLAWGAVTVLGVMGAQLNTINDNFIEYFSKETPIRRDSEFISDRLTGLHQLHFSLESGTESGVYEPEYLQRVDAFTSWLRMQPGVRHVNSISDTIKRINQEMNGSDVAFYRLPGDRQEIAQYFLLYEMSLPYGLDVTDRVDMSRAASRVTATVDNLTSKEILALDGQAQEWLMKNASKSMQAVGTGPTIMFADIGQQNAYSMLKGTLIGLALIVLTMIPAIRSVKVGILSLIPNLVPALLAFAVWGLIHGEVGLAVSIVVVMTFGIIVDDTVHLLTRYAEGRHEGLSAAEAVAEALAKVGSATIGTSLTLIAGFLVLSASSFHLNSSLGIMTAMVIAIALVAEFFLLPALLVAFDKREVNTTAAVGQPA